MTAGEVQPAVKATRRPQCAYCGNPAKSVEIVGLWRVPVCAAHELMRRRP
jgi:hypothetical protein